MQKLRYAVVVSAMLVCCTMTPVAAEVNFSIGISLPNVSIGINLPLYPQLVPVPGYPVYYAPGVQTNYFFYDGMYWVYQDDYWYTSSWYNGPWSIVDPIALPVYLLRIPVRYYQYPPAYFRGWRYDEPPRWGQYWGPQWEQHRRGWDRWNRNATPSRAPLPSYQRHFSGDRYPRLEQQQRIHQEQYRYQPRNRDFRQQQQQPRQYQQQQEQQQQYQQQPRQQYQQQQPQGMPGAAPARPKVWQEQPQPRGPQQQPHVKQPPPVKQGQPDQQQRFQQNVQPRQPAQQNERPKEHRNQGPWQKRD